MGLPKDTWLHRYCSRRGFPTRRCAARPWQPTIARRVPMPTPDTQANVRPSSPLPRAGQVPRAPDVDDCRDEAAQVVHAATGVPWLTSRPDSDTVVPRSPLRSSPRPVTCSTSMARPPRSRNRSPATRCAAGWRAIPHRPRSLRWRRELRAKRCPVPFSHYRHQSPRLLHLIQPPQPSLDALIPKNRYGWAKWCLFIGV